MGDGRFQPIPGANQRPVLWTGILYFLAIFDKNYKFYYELLKYLQSVGINPIDYIIRLIDNKDNAPSKVKDILIKFGNEAKYEWFDTPEELDKYYTEHFDYLTSGNYGKLNGKYIFKVLIECKDEFEEYLLSTALDMCGDSEIHNIMRMLSERIIDFRSSTPFEEKNIVINGTIKTNNENLWRCCCE